MRCNFIVLAPGPEWKLLVFGNEQPAGFYKGLKIIKSDDALTQAYGIDLSRWLYRLDQRKRS